MVGIHTPVLTAHDAVADITSGSRIAVGGFGMVGVPIVLIRALLDAGAHNLEIVSNNLGSDDWGLGILLKNRRIRRAISSYLGSNQEFARQYLEGELEVELTPQGTLAERLRAGGAGIPAFFTPTGVGTAVAEGGMVWRYDHEGEPAMISPPKDVRRFDSLGDDQEYVLELGIRCDFALIRAAVADRAGNCLFERSARNFNPLAAQSARVAIVEVDEVVEVGVLDPDAVHLPGIYVDRIVQHSAAERVDLPIELRTTRPREGSN